MQNAWPGDLKYGGEMAKSGGLTPLQRHSNGQACVAQKAKFFAYCHMQRLRVNSHEMRIKGRPLAKKQQKIKKFNLEDRGRCFVAFLLPKL